MITVLAGGVGAARFQAQTPGPSLEPENYGTIGPALEWFSGLLVLWFWWGGKR